MVKLILVNKNSVLKETIVKNFQEEMLYKKCNFRNANNFGNVNTFKLKHEGNDIFISVYAKNNGRANTENKYELPPPIDKELYFGNMLILKHKEETITALNVQNLTQLEWEKIYEKLMGGFEDLNEEEEEPSEDDIPEEFLSKDGYSKEDGFVVDDEDEDIEIDENSDEGNEDEEEEQDYAPTNDTEDEEEDNEEEDYDTEYTDEDSDIGSELSEESYISDEDEKGKSKEN